MSDIQVNFSFEVDSKILRDGLARVKKFVPASRQVSSILSDKIQLRVNTNGVYLEVDRYSYSIIDRISFNIREPENQIGAGVVLLGYSNLVKATKMGSGTLRITHEIPAKGTHSSPREALTKGDTSLVIDLKTKGGANVSRRIKAFPKFEDIFAGKTFEFLSCILIENNELQRALRHVLRATCATCGDNVPGNYTSCVQFVVVDKAASRKGTYKGFTEGLYLISTDGKRLNYVRLVNKGTAKRKDINILVNVLGLNALLPILKGNNSVSIRTRLYEKNISDPEGLTGEETKKSIESWGLDFDSPEFSASLGIVDTPYPEWVKVLSEDEPILKLRFNAPDYVEAIKAVSDISKMRAGRDLIGFHYEDGHLVLQAKDAETKDEATSKIPAEIIFGEPDKMFICANYEYAQGAVIDETGEVTFEYYGVLSPLVYNGTFNRVSIVMPVSNIPIGGDSEHFDVPEHVVKTNETEEDLKSETD